MHSKLLNQYYIFFVLYWFSIVHNGVIRNNPIILKSGEGKNACYLPLRVQLQKNITKYTSHYHSNTIVTYMYFFKTDCSIACYRGIYDILDSLNISRPGMDFTVSRWHHFYKQIQGVGKHTMRYISRHFVICALKVMNDKW